MADHVGPYELVRPIGTGGMGQVHLARHSGPEGFEKLLVLKTLKPDHAVDARFVTMFLDEARIAARLLHPNIIHIFDFGDTNGIYYIAMEYVPGTDLASLQADLSQKGRSIPVPLVCRILIDAANGLNYAHDLKGADGSPLGLVHRDISPHNILVGFEGGVKVIDFGIAKVAGRLSQTRTGALKGKFAYMSPEQAAGEQLDRRSDLFSLGVVFFELLTRQRLFERDSEVEILRAVQECAVPSLSKLNADCPPALEAVVAKMLARDRADRFSSGRELVGVLEAFLVENRLAASTTQLAEFVRNAYPDQVVQAATPSGVTDTVSPARRSGASDTGFGPTTVSGSRRRTRRLGVGAALIILTVGGGAFLYSRMLGAPLAPPPFSAPAEAVIALELSLGEGRSIPFTGLSSATVQTPGILDAVVHSGSHVELHTLTAGTTDVRLSAGDGRAVTYRVTVAAAARSVTPAASPGVSGTPSQPSDVPETAKPAPVEPKPAPKKPAPRPTLPFAPDKSR